MKWAKFIVSILGAAATAAAANDIVFPHIITQIIPFITAAGVYLVPNKQ